MIRVHQPFSTNELTPDVKLSMTADDVIKHQLRDNGDIIVEGWFTTETVNEMDQIVKADSFAWAEGLSLFNGRILGFHDSGSTPAGVVEGDIEIVSGKGLRGTVRIFKENADLFMRGITEGVLQFFSIGFRVLTWEFDEESEIVTFIKCQLLEISIVNSPANTEAGFVLVTNDLGTKLTFKKPESTRSNAMPGITEKAALTPEGINAIGKELGMPDYKKQVDEQAANIVKLQEVANSLKTEVENFQKGYIAKTEYVERMTKINNDFEHLTEELEKARTQIQMQSERLVFNDYRTMLNGVNGFNWLHKEDGTDYTDLDYRGHALFQLGIDYDNFDRGQELKNLRNLHDAVIMSHALARYRANAHMLQNSILYKQLVKAVEPFDNTLAHAMAGENTGFGAEWLPSELSAEFNEILRLEPTLSAKFQTWNMPKGASAKFPFQNGKAVVYKGTEAVVDNANQARKTNIATGQKVFTPFPFIGALLSSQELAEDSIVELVGFIRRELAIASLEGLDSAIINGDDAATHMDNAHNTQWAAWTVETGFDGLRFDGNAAGAFDTGGTVASLSIDDMLAIRAIQGAAAVKKPSDSIWITGVKGKQEIKLAILAEGLDSLVSPVIITGGLPTVDGSEVHISEMYLEDLDADGFGAATMGSGKFTSIVSVHTPSYRIGQRRGVTIEVAKDILTQQLQFVSTARWDFGKISADSVVPTAVGIDVQHTA